MRGSVTVNFDDWGSVSSASNWSDESEYDSASERDLETEDDHEPGPVQPYSPRFAKSTPSLSYPPAQYRRTPAELSGERRSQPVVPEPLLPERHQRPSVRRNIEALENATPQRRVRFSDVPDGPHTSSSTSAPFPSLSRSSSFSSTRSFASNESTAPQAYKSKMRTRPRERESLTTHTTLRRQSTAPSELSFFARRGDEIPVSVPAYRRPVGTFVHHVSQDAVDRLRSSHRRAASSPNALFSGLNSTSRPSRVSQATPQGPSNRRQPIIPPRVRKISGTISQAANAMINSVRKMASRTNMRGAAQ